MDTVAGLTAGRGLFAFLRFFTSSLHEPTTSCLNTNIPFSPPICDCSFAECRHVVMSSIAWQNGNDIVRLGKRPASVASN